MLFRLWPHRKTSRTNTPSRPSRFRPCLELLEKREVLSQMLLVTTTANSGPGSLSAAILQADADGGGDHIFFNIASGVQTITLQRPLPQITAPMTIDGYGQGTAITPLNLATPNTLDPGLGTNANLSVQLTPAPGGPAFGLRVAAGGVVIRGLSIFGFQGAGIDLANVRSTGSQVAGDFLGVNALGEAPSSKNAIGVLVDQLGNGNTIGGLANADRNLISANAAEGIFIDPDSDSNTVVNNLVGTEKLGGGALGNGVGISVQGSRNSIGGTTAAARNIISGSATHGVYILNAPNNQVLGNYIGTSANGQSAVANQQAGVLLDGASGTTISGNLISANDSSGNAAYGGVVIGVAKNALANNNVVAGNTIGLAADHFKPLPNGVAGVLVVNTNAGTVVGGTTLAARNVIAGNNGDGVAITAGASAVVVQGNYIGLTDANGPPGRGNLGAGVRVTGGSATIGTPGSAASNIISNNTGAGVLVNSSGTALIQGNYIGLGADGLTPVGNGKQGVFLDKDDGSTVGGTTAGAGNVISGNIAHAVDIFQADGNDVVQGNRIGTNAAGTGAVGNGGVGVLVNNVNGSSKVTIGGPAAGAGNLISGNRGGGVDVYGSSNTVVAGNLIGTDVTGQRALGNANYGVQVENSNGINTIGGNVAGAGNLISGNGGNGINALAGDVFIRGNKIGTNLAGDAALPNAGSGVFTTTLALVGGPNAAFRNVISGNTQYGVFVQNSRTAFIESNYIGTNADGTASLGGQLNGVNIVGSTAVYVSHNVISGNVNSGVAISGGSSINIAGNEIGTDVSGAAAVPNQNGISAVSTADLNIGGISASERNVVSGNTANGLLLQGGSSLTVRGNYIGTNAAGSAALANGLNGIQTLSANGQFVSNLVVAGNVISGNSRTGLRISTVAGATIQANFIGTDAAGTAKVANGGDGGVSVDSSTDVTIGGADPSARNVISGNTADGIHLFAGGPVKIQGNYIGTDVTGAAALGNGQEGVSASGGNNGKADNTIGGTTAAAGNVISGNGDAGVLVVNGTGNLLGFNRIGTNAAGTAALPNLVGVRIAAAGNTVQDNLISGNTNQGVLIAAANNKLLRNTIGLNLAGTAALPNAIGVEVAGGGGNVIGSTADHNIISGNTGAGVLVENATGTTLLGNRIGTSADGAAPVGNSGAGVIVSTGAVKTTIGGTAKDAGNLVSGNTGTGVQVQGNADATLIQGNQIGLNAPGFGPLANQAGIVVQGTAAGTTIGGTASGAGNLISFNDLSGIDVAGTPTKTLIQGNTIGLDAIRASAPNLKNGITIQGGTDTTVGGSPAGANVVSGNNGNGIEVSGADVQRLATISDNLIGTSPSGMVAQANGMAGVLIADATAALRVNVMGNVISGNANQGVFINASPRVAVGDNLIGLNKLGTAALPNGSDGVLLNNATNCVIGLDGGNVIAGNLGDGIRAGGGSTGTQIYANTIGLLKGGAQKAANAGAGVNVTDTANNTTIGGATAERLNVISGNAGHGINIDVNTSGTLLQGNTIGLNKARTAAVANGGNGVNVEGPGVTVGGTDNGTGNVIAGNKGNGVLVSGAKANGTVIQGNYIGTNGTVALGNGVNGIQVVNASKVTIGAARAGNVISGNGQFGIQVVRTGQESLTGTFIQGNYIGTDATGTAALGNAQSGVRLDSTSGATLFKNTISGNTEDGISLSNAVNTSLTSNQIGTTADLKGALGNGNDGIQVGGTSDKTTAVGNRIAANGANGVEFGVSARNLTLQSNFVGLAFKGAGNNVGVLLNGTDATLDINVIRNSTAAGIQVNATASLIKIQGNTIGSASNATPTPNGTGIFVNGATSVTIGGDFFRADNIISGNTQDGIRLANVAADPSAPLRIAGNFIGTNREESAKVPNGQNGILLESSSGVKIFGNTIAGNGANGVLLDKGSSFNLIQLNSIGIAAVGGTAIGNSGFGVFVQNGSSRPNLTYRVEFFASDQADSSGFGQGRTFLGFQNVTTDANGNATFDATLPVRVAAGKVVSATATDPDGNTSEMSRAVVVVAPSPPKLLAADPGLSPSPNLAAADGPGTVARLAQTLRSAPEYLAQSGGSPDGLVAGLYRDVLGRAGAPVEWSLWTQALTGGASPADVAAAFFTSREYPEGVLRSSYSELLGREVDVAGLATWAGALAGGVAEGDVLAAVLNTPEGFAYWS
jgi:parallel beta-helix repeat protein